MYTAYSKQKLKTKRSTEAELVAVDNAMGQILRTRHFLVAQGIHYLPQQYTKTTKEQCCQKIEGCQAASEPNTSI